MTLEKLLNKLIEKGWKPRWFENVYKFKLYKLWYTIARPQKQKMISFATETIHYINWTDYIWYKWYSLRELVSKNSWLWQFVCKNDMADDWIWVWRQKVEINKKWNTKRKSLKSWKWREEYEYRLIESALKDESELEDFLLNNIKIDG